MNAQENLIDQLEQAFAHQDIRHRAETLRRVTDLFMTGSGRYSDEQVALFDEVMSRLVEAIDASARAAFGRRLAAMPDAPPRVLRELALDDAIDVAGPVLSRSEGLEEATLIEGAQTRSQQHLLAISRRRTLPEPLTDVLVRRGDRTVAVSTAENAGARFSEFGYSTLVSRAQDDNDLALAIWVRPEIPRQHLLQLFAEASESVRQKLDAADRANGGLLQDLIAQASNRIQERMRDGSAGYAPARAHVQALHQQGELDERRLVEFARAGKFDETTVALSLMADLPIGVVERAIANRRTEQILVLAKAIALDWQSARAILLLQAGAKGSSTPELDHWCAMYARLRPDTARKAIQFYRLRERATAN
jgi:uncharacterized protein (DUF2336 family)